MAALYCSTYIIRLKYRVMLFEPFFPIVTGNNLYNISIGYIIIIVIIKSNILLIKLHISEHENCISVVFLIPLLFTLLQKSHNMHTIQRPENTLAFRVFFCFGHSLKQKRKYIFLHHPLQVLLKMAASIYNPLH